LGSPLRKRGDRGDFASSLLVGRGNLLLEGGNNLQPRSYGPCGIIFVCDGIAKVDEQTVAEILGNVSVVSLDYLFTGLLILSHDLTQFFRIKLG
jgi:hypothetical protein